MRVIIHPQTKNLPIFYNIFSLLSRGCCSLSLSLNTSRRRLNKWVLLLQMGLRNVRVVYLDEAVFLVIDPILLFRLSTLTTTLNSRETVRLDDEVDVRLNPLLMGSDLFCWNFFMGLLEAWFWFWVCRVCVCCCEWVFCRGCVVAVNGLKERKNNI